MRYRPTGTVLQPARCNLHILPTAQRNPHRRSVLLPLPDGPMIATIWPALMWPQQPLSSVLPGTCRQLGGRADSTYTMALCLGPPKHHLIRQQGRGPPCQVPTLRQRLENMTPSSGRPIFRLLLRERRICRSGEAAVTAPSDAAGQRRAAPLRSKQGSGHLPLSPCASASLR